MFFMTLDQFYNLAVPEILSNLPEEIRNQWDRLIPISDLPLGDGKLVWGIDEDIMDALPTDVIKKIETWFHEVNF